MFPGRFVTFALATLILAGMLFGCGQQVKDITFAAKSPEAKKFFLEGLEKNDFFYFEEARELFEKATVADPEFAMAYYYWALSATTTADFQDRLKKAVELVEKVSEPERLIIMSLKAGNDDSAGLAREYVEQMVNLLPEGKRAHTILGGFYFGQQEWALAEREYRKVIEIEPEFAPVYNQLGYLLSNLDRYPEAIEALKKYSELRPEDPNPHDSMGEIYLWMSDHENSIKEFSRSLELDPNFIISIAGIGHNHVFMKEFGKARDKYDEIHNYAETVADTNTAFFWKAVSYVHENKHDKAIEVLKDQLDFVKSHDNIYLEVTIHNQIAAIYEEKGDFKNALSAANRAREIAMQPEIEPGVREGYIRFCAFNEALAFARQGKQKMANSKVEEFKKSAEASKNPIAMKNSHSVMGIVAYWNKDYQIAINELEQGNPQDPYGKYYLGLSYEKSGQEQQARDIFSEVANYNRNSLFYAFVRPAAMAKM